jgi:hypothetical protein
MSEHFEKVQKVITKNITTHNTTLGTFITPFLQRTGEDDSKKPGIAENVLSFTKLFLAKFSSVAFPKDNLKKDTVVKTEFAFGDFANEAKYLEWIKKIETKGFTKAGKLLRIEYRLI